MDSSSDGSFTWTDASDDLLENKNMAKSNNNTRQSGDESESGKTYKKNLQQRLFSGGHEEESSNVSVLKERKRKMSTQINSENETIKSPKKKRIKIEPESDVDATKLRKKHKSLETTIKSPNESYDEDFLDSKVKAEQKFIVPSAVKTKKNKNKDKSRDISLNNTDVNNESYDMSSCSETHEKKHINTQIHYDDDSSQIEKECSHLEEDDETRTRKKKKSKKKRKQLDSEHSEHETIIKTSFCAEETVIHEVSQQNQQSKETIIEVVEIIPNGHTPNKDVTKVNSDSISHIGKARISERITFEDEDDSDGQTKNAQTKPVTPKTSTTKKVKTKLNTFIESSENLRPLLSKLPEALVLNEDDDIWVVQCPKDINVKSFQDKKWALDTKCKIKLSEQTYEGCFEDEVRYMTIMNAENDSRVIKNLLIRGSVRLRRRIPKAHIQDNNIMVNNQNNFIPLPETKGRHPLFGSDYKKALKLPSAVRERLQAAQDHSNMMDKKKKKKDRGKLEQNETSIPKLEQTGDMGAEVADLSQTISTSKKKKKKRKHSDTMEESRPKKKIKHNPESVEAWESEKAIEEHLFDF